MDRKFKFMPIGCKEKALKVLKESELQFCEKLNPENILLYLPSMDIPSREEIEREQRNYGEYKATPLLLKRIRQKEKCLIEFIKALRNSNIQHYDLADLLDPNHVYDTGQTTEDNSPGITGHERTIDMLPSVNPRPIQNIEGHKRTIDMLPSVSPRPIQNIEGHKRTIDMLPSVSPRPIQNIEGHKRTIDMLHSVNPRPIQNIEGHERTIDMSPSVSPRQNIDGQTPIRHLPYKALREVYRLDYDDKWKDLAAHLEYTLEEVQKIKTLGSQKSCSEKLIEEWSNGDRPVKANVNNLFQALERMERIDLISTLEKVLNFKYLKPNHYTPFIDDSNEPFMSIRDKGMNGETTQNSHRSESTGLVAQPESSHKLNHDIDGFSESKSPVVQVESTDKLQQDIDMLEGPVVVPVTCFTEPCTAKNSTLCGTEDIRSFSQNSENEMFSIEDNTKQVFRENRSKGRVQVVNDCDIWIGSENNNTKFVEKTLKDKVIDTAKLNPLVMVGIVGGITALGMFAMSRSS